MLMWITLLRGILMSVDKISDKWQTPQALFDELNEEFGPFDIDLCANKENSKCKEYYSDYLSNEFWFDSGTFLGMMQESRSMKFNKGRVCFMNPPYSNPKPFIEKAWEDSKHCKIVCLVKCDPSTKWWGTFWEYSARIESFNNDRCGDTRLIKQGPKPGCDYKLFPKRIKFDPPEGLINSGEVQKVDNNWFRKCSRCGTWDCYGTQIKGIMCDDKSAKLSGPTFSSALIIMDRRSV